MKINYFEVFSVISYKQDSVEPNKTVFTKICSSQTRKKIKMLRQVTDFSTNK